MSVSNLKAEQRAALTFVAETALVEPKRPVRHLRGRPDHVRILAHKRGRVGLAAREEIEVQNAADYVVLERRPRALSVVQFDVHPVRVQEQDAVCARGPVLEVDRVVPVQVLALGEPVRVPGPHRARVVVRREAERVRVLAEPVDVRVRGQVRLHAQVLGLEDDRVRRGGEEDLVRLGAVDGEREGRIGVVEPDVGGRRVGLGVGLGTGQDLFRHFISVVRGVGDFDVNAIL